MATREQKQELVETLKFTPVTYSVQVSGYGGEIVMGRVNNAVVDFFRKNRVDLEEYASSWGEPGDEGYIDVPELFQPFPQGSWYDCDNIEHCSGAEFGGAWITVYDENGSAVWEQELGYDLEEQGCQLECFCEEEVYNHVSDKEAVFVGQNFEKGTFFEADLYLQQPFDPAKFKFTYSDIAGWSVLNVVEYDGEELDGSDAYSTNGKSSSYEFFYRTADGDIETYNRPEDDNEDVPVLEGEEEWASKAIDDDLSNESVSSFSTLVQALADARNNDWNSTEIRPPVKGEYEVKFVEGTWPLGDVRTAEWTGRSWKENGKKAPDMLGWREVEEN